MFYRAFVVGIVAFWVLMMTLLVSVELFPAESKLLPVPPEYVWKLMFLHEQPSALVLYSQRQRIGNFHLEPRRLPTGTDGSGPLSLLTGSGALTLNLPGLNGQRITLRGSLEMDDRNTVRRFTVNASLHETGQNGPGLTAVIDGQPTREQWHYQVRRGDRVLQENSGASAILLDALDVPLLGINPHTIFQAGQQQAAMARITARRGVLHTNSEDIEAYVVTIRHAESLETTMYVSQLGQILAVKTFSGYDLYDDNLTP